MKPIISKIGKLNATMKMKSKTGSARHAKATFQNLILCLMTTRVK